MRYFYSETQDCHAPQTFLLRGEPAPSPESPERATRLAAAITDIGGRLEAPRQADSIALRGRLMRVHTSRYLDFLDTIYTRWQSMPGAAERVAPNVHPVGGGYHYPEHPVGLAGWHMHDMACPMTADSAYGIFASAASAEAAALAVMDGEPAAYALCRPPGHHAGPERAGGFCFLNNAALAASVLRERHERVAIVDVDLHHGNGTQDIFYARGDVWTGSLHADTRQFYPFFWGGADEQGSGEGMGANRNLPMALGSDGDTFLSTLDTLLEEMAAFDPQAVVIALGLDAHKDDPLAGLALETEDFYRLGERLGRLSPPCVIIQEGGYPTASLGQNLAAFLNGFYTTTSGATTGE